MRWETPPVTSTTSYWVRVSNAHGADDSVTATMTVVEAAPPPPPEPPPPPPPPPSPPVDTSDAFEDEVIGLVNQHRAAGASCGGNPYPAVDPLSLDANLRAAAWAHSADMGTNGYFSHTSQDGTTFSQRIWNAGYSGGFPVGENIAAGQSMPASVVSGWMSSPGHCANIMNAGFTDIGVGYAFVAGSPYGSYWTQDFGGG